jgi:hypothetical protein
MDRRPHSLSLPLPAGENGRRRRLAARQALQHRCHRRRRGQRPTAPGFVVVVVVVVGPCAMEEPHLHSLCGTPTNDRRTNANAHGNRGKWRRMR